MKLSKLGAATALVAAAVLLAAVPASGRPPGAKIDLDRSSGRWVPGELVVRFRASVAKPARVNVHAVRGARVSKRIGRYGIDVVRLPRGLPVRQALASYEADPRVESAEPNYRRKLYGPPPDDTRFTNLWGLANAGQEHPIADPQPPAAEGEIGADIGILDAWDTQKGAATTVIAVVDNGFDVTHPDLVNSLWTNPVELAGTVGVDDDGNGYTDDVHGWDFGEQDATLLGPDEHGTHVAGTIAAERDNNEGIAGVCPGCKVMLLKIADAAGFLTLSAELEALAYAETMGAHVVNASFGGPEWIGSEREAIRSAGFLFVAAAGNDSLDNDMFLSASPAYPASYDLPNVLAVGASNHNDEFGYNTGCRERGGTRPSCSFSNWGHDSVDLVAPGVDIDSTVPGASYAVINGTSMAAPHVAGVAGLVKSGFPLYTAADLRNAILNGVEKPPTLRTLFSTLFLKPRSGSFVGTDGRLDAVGALAGDTSRALPKSDGTIAGAKRLRASIRRPIAWPHDVNDVYWKKLRRGKTYEAVLTGPRGQDFDLYIWKPGTKEIWQITAACPGKSCKLLKAGTSPNANERIRFKAPGTGIFYFQVSAWLKMKGKYKLTVRPI